MRKRGKRGRGRSNSRHSHKHKHKHKHGGVIHVQHHKSKKPTSRGWAFMEFGVPLIFFGLIVFSILGTFFDLSNGFVFLVGFAITIFLSIKASKKLARLYNRMSDYLNE